MPWLTSVFQGLYSDWNWDQMPGTWLLHLACLSKRHLTLQGFSGPLSPSGKPSFLLSFKFGQPPQLAEVLVPRPGMTPGPWQWKFGGYWAIKEFPSMVFFKMAVQAQKERVKDARLSCCPMSMEVSISLSLHLTDERSCRLCLDPQTPVVYENRDTYRNCGICRESFWGQLLTIWVFQSFT